MVASIPPGLDNRFQRSVLDGGFAYALDLGP